MSKAKTKTIAEKFTDDVLKDEYFNSLYSKSSKLLANNIFGEKNDQFVLTQKELNDVLRFSDILSNSKRPEARNKAYQIITLLNETYKNDPYYRTFAHSVMAKLGNFPGIQYLSETDNNNSELPYERFIEKKIKEFVQAVPDTDGLVFTDSQYELYRQISGSKFYSFSGPTSMGKSFIIKSFIRKAISNTPPENIVIMVPTRALINQFSIDLNKELKDTLEHHNYKVVTNSSITELPDDKQQLYIFVLTPERLISYLSQKDNPPLGYLFVDEAHKIAAEKDMRSVTAYTAISKALKKNQNLNLYFASPNVANPDVFLKMFKKDISKSYRTIEAPVSQNLFFINLLDKKVCHYVDNVPTEFESKLVDEATTFFDVLHKIGENENNIVYCSSRFNAVDKSHELFKSYSNKEVEVSKNVKKTIQQIKAYIHKDYYLADFLSKGIAYHFGNLPQIIRNKIEALFKESEINYVFCTSTLLEGVNLPAKNVFILNDKNGRQTLQPIDFWNLAGRAGRLKYELSGNIFCIKENASDWKHPELLDRSVEISLNPTVDNYIDRKLKKIEEILKENKDVRIETETMREIPSYIANIINIDTLELKRTKYKSELIKKLIENNKEAIIELAKKSTDKIEVPSSVLSANQSVNMKIQNIVYKELKKHAKNPLAIKLPTQIDYDTCKTILKKFYTLFKWETEEKHFKSIAQLDYYAMLMNQWINGIPLSQIINQSIDYYNDKQREIKVGFKPNEREIFSKNNKKHVNILIGSIIEDIEHILRFLFEKYFNNYYFMLVEILGEDNAGVNWAAFLEYGSRNSTVIALQNYGLSRHTANYIFNKHKNCLKVEGEKLIEINIPKLRQALNRDDIEFDEISSILF